MLILRLYRIQLFCFCDEFVYPGISNIEIYLGGGVGGPVKEVVT